MHMESKFKKLGLLILTLLLISCRSNEKKKEEIKVEYEVPSHLSKGNTSYFLIGHADTQNKNLSNSTELSEKGFEQAAFWGDYFSDKELDRFYTTTETFAFQTMIPIVHPYKGQVRDIDKEFKFDQEFWNKTYGQRSVIISSEEQNTNFANEILQYNKYKVTDVDENYLIKIQINKMRQVKDTLIKF